MTLASLSLPPAWLSLSLRVARDCWCQCCESAESERTRSRDAFNALYDHHLREVGMRDAYIDVLLADLAERDEEGAPSEPR